LLFTAAYSSRAAAALNPARKDVSAAGGAAGATSQVANIRMSAEEQRRQYERQLVEVTELLRSAQHGAARVSEQEVSRTRRR
jgi:hypothetical protein